MVDEHSEEASAGDPAAGSPDRSRDIYTIANIITVLRLILVPFFFAVLIRPRPRNFAAFVLFAVAASTDWLDGQIARRTGTVTALGQAIDPLVDRLLIASGVFGLWIIGRLPGWIVFLLVARDVYLGYGVWRLEQMHHRRMAVTIPGKITTALLLTGFAGLVLGWPPVPGAGLVDTRLLPGFGHSPAMLGIWFVYLGMLFSIGTAIQYTFIFRRMAREARRPEVPEPA